MRIGFVGLGKMGSQIVRKLLDAQHEVVVYDVNASAINDLVVKGAEGADSEQDLVAKLGEKPVLWLMIPSDFVEAEVNKYIELLPQGSTLVDGGNSNYRESIRRAETAEKRGIRFVDVGTSGGVMGLDSGFSLMAGCDDVSFRAIEPIIKVLSLPSGGYRHVGPCGYGHYVKMIHNGIEYAIMQAYAEGYDLLKYGPLPNIDLAEVAGVWQEGSIINSKLNELIENILKKNPELDGVDGFVAASGEGQWTYETAKQAGVGMPALKSALDVREASQNGKVFYATKLLAEMRHAFGGHAINKDEK